MTDRQQYVAFGRPGWSSSSAGRPRTVAAAAWITAVVTGLTLASVLVSVVANLVADWHFYQWMVQSSSTSSLGVLVLVAGLALVGWCVLALVSAYFAYRRRSWARITLAASSAITALVTVPFAFAGAVVWTAAAVAVVVLLFSGSANEWYRSGPTGAARSPKPPPRELPKFY